MLRHLIRKRPRHKGLALVLTLFVVVILVTLSTAFAILVVNENHGSLGDKNSVIARQMAFAGVDTAIAYMGVPLNWGTVRVTDPVSQVNPEFVLVTPGSGTSTPTVPKGTINLGSENLASWTNAPFTRPDGTVLSVPVTVSNSTAAAALIFGTQTPPNTDFSYEMDLGTSSTTLTRIPIDANFEGTVTLLIQREGVGPAGDPNNTSLAGSSADDYAIQSTAQIFQVGSSKAISSRVVLARIRMAATTDNSRELTFGTSTGGTGGITWNLGSGFTNGMSNGNSSQQAAFNALQQQVSAISQNAGEPFGEQVQGNVTMIQSPQNDAPGLISGQASLLGSVNDFKTGGQGGNLPVTSFGRNAAFGSTNNSFGFSFPEITDNNGLNASDTSSALNQLKSVGVTQSNIFQKGTSGIAANQIPGSGDNPTATNISVGNNSSFTAEENTFTSHVSQEETLAQTLAGQNNGHGEALGALVTVDSQGGNVATVTPGGSGTRTGSSDIEVAVDSSKNPIPGAPPGMPVVQIAFQADGSAQIKKFGAYSGQQLGSTQTVAPGGLIYVDGGNVQVSGTNNGSMTIIAGASSQRPTADAFDPLNPNLIRYPQVNSPSDLGQYNQGANIQMAVNGNASVTAAPLSNSMYASPDSAVFFPNGANSAPVFPVTVTDPTSGASRTLWPAWDPAILSNTTGSINFPGGAQQANFANLYGMTAGTGTVDGSFGQNSLFLHDDALYREGNITLTGDTGSSSNSASSPSLGLVAQNYVFASDQSNRGLGTPFSVNGTIQSLSQNFEWAGLTTQQAQSGAIGNYFVGFSTPQTLRGNNTYNGINGQDGIGIPLPANQNTLTATTVEGSGSFNLTGSIIAPFEDIEGTFVEQNGSDQQGQFLGYAKQSTTLSTARPPGFVQTTFTRDITEGRTINTSDSQEVGEIESLALTQVQWVIEGIQDQGALGGQ